MHLLLFFFWFVFIFVLRFCALHMCNACFAYEIRIVVRWYHHCWALAWNMLIGICFTVIISPYGVHTVHTLTQTHTHIHLIQYLLLLLSLLIRSPSLRRSFCPFRLRKMPVSCLFWIHGMQHSTTQHRTPKPIINYSFKLSNVQMSIHIKIVVPNRSKQFTTAN